jgi:hypothetical protein
MLSLPAPGDMGVDIRYPAQGYRTCYYRTFGAGSAPPSQQAAYARARGWMDASIAVRSGLGTEEEVVLTDEGPSSSPCLRPTSS